MRWWETGVTYMEDKWKDRQMEVMRREEAELGVRCVQVRGNVVSFKYPLPISQSVEHIHYLQLQRD